MNPKEILDDSVRALTRTQLAERIRALPKDLRGIERQEALGPIFVHIAECCRRGEEAGLIDEMKKQFKLTSNEVYYAKENVLAARAKLKANGAAALPGAKEKKDKSAHYEDYKDFIFRICNPVKCKLTGEIMAVMNKELTPVENKLNLLKSHADDTDGFIMPGKIEWHLERLKDELEPTLIIPIPVWDKVDRLKQISECLKLANMTPQNAYEFLCEFGATMMSRWEHPKEQNRILILKGGQGIGKDFLVDVLVGGLGHYCKNLIVSKNDKELERLLPSALLFRISEYDRTSRTEVATLKHILTTPSATSRDLYKRVAYTKPVVCSFIATCNVHDILRDYTGSRRFMILDLEEINWDYPITATDSYQILAQWKELAKTGYAASMDSEEALDRYLKLLTPPNIFDEAVELFDDYCYYSLPQFIADQGRASNNDLLKAEIDGKQFDVFARVARETSLTTNQIKNYLKQKGRWARTGKERFWVFNIPAHKPDVTPEEQLHF